MTILLALATVLAVPQDADFAFQGEYLGQSNNRTTGKEETVGVQVIALGKGKFTLVAHGGDCRVRAGTVLKRKRSSGRERQSTAFPRS